jgi:hypothetical protein
MNAPAVEGALPATTVALLSASFAAVTASSLISAVVMALLLTLAVPIVLSVEMVPRPSVVRAVAASASSISERPKLVRPVTA